MGHTHSPCIWLSGAACFAKGGKADKLIRSEEADKLNEGALEVGRTPVPQKALSLTSFRKGLLEAFEKRLKGLLKDRETR